MCVEAPSTQSTGANSEILVGRSHPAGVCSYASRLRDRTRSFLSRRDAMRMMLGLLVAVVIGCGPTAKPGGDDDGGDDTPGPDSGNCAAESTNAMAVKRPSDIIWVIDNSGSMDEEEARVQQNMNAFAQS